MARSPFSPATDRAVRLAALSALPCEAVGFIWRPPGQAEAVIPLLNTSEAPENSYAIEVEAAARAFTDFTGSDIVDVAEGDLLLWHSHPSGYVGPSQGDLQAKLPGLRYMVVVLSHTSEDITYVEF